MGNPFALDLGQISALQFSGCRLLYIKNRKMLQGIILYTWEQRSFMNIECEIVGIDSR